MLYYHCLNVLVSHSFICIVHLWILPSQFCHFALVHCMAAMTAFWPPTSVVSFAIPITRESFDFPSFLWKPLSIMLSFACVSQMESWNFSTNNSQVLCMNVICNHQALKTIVDFLTWLYRVVGKLPVIWPWHTCLSAPLTTPYQLNLVLANFQTSTLLINCAADIFARRSGFDHRIGLLVLLMFACFASTCAVLNLANSFGIILLLNVALMLWWPLLYLIACHTYYSMFHTPK